MNTLRQDGLRLCLEGVSSLDEIRRVTGDRSLGRASLRLSVVRSRIREAYAASPGLSELASL